MIPMCERGYDQGTEIVENPVHCFTRLGPDRGQLRLELSRFYVGEDGIVSHMAQIVGHPVHHLVSILSEFFSVHVFSSIQPYSPLERRKATEQTNAGTAPFRPAPQRSALEPPAPL